MASQRVPRGPAGGRLRVASMATQSCWRPHGTQPRARRVASSPQLAMGAATVWPTPPSPFERRLQILNEKHLRTDASQTLIQTHLLGV